MKISNGADEAENSTPLLPEKRKQIMKFPDACEEPILQHDHLVGVTNESFTPEFISGLATAFGTVLKETDIVLVGCDLRYDSQMLKRCFTASIISTGVSVFDLSIISGTVLQFLIRRFGASAGVLFSASHSRPKSIEIRIFNELGIEVSKTTLQNILACSSSSVETTIRRTKPEKIGRVFNPSNVEEIYRTALTRVIDTQIISKMRLTVTVDCSFSAISQIVPSLLVDMNFNVVSLNSFHPVHLPEVLPNNQSLMVLAKSLSAIGGDLGMVFDQQGSHVHFIGNRGTFIEPSEVAMLLALNRIQHAEKGKSVIVISEYLGEAIRKTLEDAGATVETVDITANSLPQAIKHHRGIFGAADDGSYYYPAFSSGRECILASFYLLSILAQEDQLLTQLVHPYAHQRTETIQKLSNLQQLMSRLGTLRSSIFKIIDTIIGYKFIFPDRGWVHLRPTQFPDVYRLLGQGGETSTEQELFKRVRNTLKEIQEQINLEKQAEELTDQHPKFKSSTWESKRRSHTPQHQMN
ncbi:MAG: hypothetical protein ACFFDI_06500 [Promethearchaeota archaeon]